jgi:uncharacterized membrane-anchored protein
MPTGQEMQAAAQAGPAQVRLGDQAAIALPAGYVFLPAAITQRMLAAKGHQAVDNVVGAILPRDGGWSMFMTFDKSGYIRDDESKSIDAGRLLKRMQDAEEDANIKKRKLGLNGLRAVGWIEKPYYNEAEKALVWSLEVQQLDPSGRPTGDAPAVNYTVAKLGREGYLAMDMVARRSVIDQYKGQALALAQATQYVQGKRYQDFDPKTDKVAAFGLLALIGGLAAHKLGLFAAAGVLLLKFGKLIGLGAVGGLAALKGRRRRG